MEKNDYIVVYLKPGELYAGADPVVIKTVLGSCVSVCLHDKVNRLGGANHYLLPRQREGSESPLNYGENSIPELIENVLREGGERKSLVAQIVGGSCTRAAAVIDVGQNNIQLAKEILAAHSIPIVYEDVGGNHGRVIRFYPNSNELFIRRAGGQDEEEAANVPREESFVQLSASQRNFLTNMFSIGLQRAEHSLSSMLATPSRIEVADVMLRPLWYAQEYGIRKFSEFLITTGQRDRGTLGEILMMIEPSKMGMLVNGLLRRDLGTPIQYDRMESSVMVEFTNIVVNAILGTLANHLGFTMMLRVPKLVRDRQEVATLAFMNQSRRWRLSLATRTKVSIPAWKMDTSLLLLIEISSTPNFFKKMAEYLK